MSLFLCQVMECQLSVIPPCHRVLIKVTPETLGSCKSIHTLDGSWQRQTQHIINDNSPSQWQEHIWQLLLMAVIFMWCQAVMFKVGFICQDCRAQMLILQGWLVSTSSPSHAFLLKLSQTSADRGSGITVVSFYCCCLSKGAYIESNFPLKGANCSQKIVTAIAWRWLAAYLLFCWVGNGRISYAGGGRGEGGRKGAAHIIKDVLWKMSVKIHKLQMMKRLLFLAGGEEIEIWCVCLLCRDVCCAVGVQLLL